MFIPNHSTKEKTILFIEFTPNFGSVNGLINQLIFMKEKYPNRYNVIIIGRKRSVLNEISPELYTCKYTMEPAELDRLSISFISTSLGYIKTLLLCLNIALRHNPDVIHCYHYMWSMYANPIGFILNKPVIVHLKDVWQLEPKISRILMKFNPKTRYIAVSLYVKKLFTEVYKVNEKKIITIYDGVNVKFFKPLKKIPVKDNKNKKIVMFGRLEPERDLEIMIDTASIIINKYPNVVFHHYGYLKGRFDENYISQLRKRVKDLNIEKNFLLKNYVRSFKEIARIYHDSYLTLITARQFALPNTAIESMMCGIPVVAYNCGGNPEIVTTGKNGSLVPHLSPVFFAREISKYLEQNYDYPAYSKAAINSAHEKFNSEKIFDEVLALY